MNIKNMTKKTMSMMFTDKAGELSPNRISGTVSSMSVLPVITFMSTLPASYFITVPIGILTGGIIGTLSGKKIWSDRETLKTWRLGTDEALQINNKR